VQVNPERQFERRDRERSFIEDVGDFPMVVQEGVQRDLQAMLPGAILAGLEAVGGAELGRVVGVGADWYARVAERRNRRNGTHVRRLLTTLGAIELTVHGPLACTVQNRGPRRVGRRGVGGHFWSAFLQQPVQRGLSGVRLVIVDEQASLARAVRPWLPEVVFAGAGPFASNGVRVQPLRHRRRNVQLVRPFRKPMSNEPGGSMPVDDQWPFTV